VWLSVQWKQLLRAETTDVIISCCRRIDVHEGGAEADVVAADAGHALGQTLELERHLVADREVAVDGVRLVLVVGHQQRRPAGVVVIPGIDAHAAVGRPVLVAGHAEGDPGRPRRRWCPRRAAPEGTLWLIRWAAWPAILPYRADNWRAKDFLKWGVVGGPGRGTLSGLCVCRGAMQPISGPAGGPRATAVCKTRRRNATHYVVFS
jgi:hypothetical protein